MVDGPDGAGAGLERQAQAGAFAPPWFVCASVQWTDTVVSSRAVTDAHTACSVYM